MDDDQGFFSNLQLDDDDPKKVLAGLLSPTDAQTLESSPPVAPAVSGPGQSTPRTGNLAAAPSQAQPRVSGPAMLPGVAMKPENLVAQAAPVPASASSTIIRALPGGMSGTPSRFVRQPVASSAPTSLASIPGYRSGGGQSSPATPVPTAVAPSQPQGTPSRQRWNRVVGGQTNKITPAAIQAANAPAAAINAAGPGAPLSSVGPTNMPDLGTQPLPTLGPAPRGTLPGDTAEYNRLQNTGAGVSQVRNPLLRTLGHIGDAVETEFAPGLALITPGTTLNNERLVAQAAGRVGADTTAQQAVAQLADTQGQTQYRQQQAAREAAQAQADTTRQPTPQEAADYSLDPQAYYRPSDIGRAAVQAAKNTATLQTHTGGQSRTLSADDAAAIDMPSLAGATMSNDEYQRTLQQRQRNQQSGSNTAANNATRVTTTNMRDATSAGNSARAHGGKGAVTPKPIPAGVRDRIQSQKDTALGKARADLDSGASTMDDYLNAWQAAQNDYEDRLSAQTGQPIAHTDIRSNVDSKGNWRGGNQPATAQPQAQQPAKRPDFTTRKGTAVSIGDPVNVGGRKGTVTGFNPTSGKAQVKWEGQ